MPATRTRKSRKAPGAKSKAFAEQRRAEVAAMTARLADFAGTPEGAALIAQATATLDNYSERNAALIASQMPTATDVSGFRQWQARGRRVRKGETGLRILAPAGSKTVESDVEGGEDAVLRFFKPVSVFDISQTITVEEWEAQRADLAAADVEDEDYDLAA